MDFNKLFVFYKAALKKQFSNTGLTLSPSGVSRHVADLESELGFVLFYRTPKGLILTPKGKLLFDRTEAMFPELLELTTSLGSQDEQVEQPFTLVSPTSWASHILICRIGDFLASNKNVNLTIISDDSAVDFSVENAADMAAVLPYSPKTENLVRRFLLSATLKLYAHRNYLQKFGKPKSISDLDHHCLIATAHRDKNLGDINWHLTVGKPANCARRPYLTLNDTHLAALEGIGIASLVDKNKHVESGELEPVLEDISGPSLSAYYVYPQFAKNSKIVKKMGAFLASVF